MSTLLQRFRADGRNAVPLNELQRKTRQQFEEKVKKGYYHLTDVSCLCGATTNDAVLMSEKERHGLATKIWLCKRCTLIYMSPYFDDSSVLRFYTEDYRDLYDGLEQPTERFFNNQYLDGQQMARFVLHALPELPRWDVFEIGCGAGGILKNFADLGCSCRGCDVDPRYVGYGQRQGLDIVQKDFLSLPPDAPVDLVVLSHVLEHLIHPRDILNAIRKLLKPNAYLYVEVPNTIPGISLMGQFQNAHIWYFDLPTLDSLLRECGFEIMHWEAPYHLRVLAQLAPGPFPSNLQPTPYQTKWRQFYWAECRLACKQAGGRFLARLGLKETIKNGFPFPS